jgi:hypothetical protein
MAAPRGVSGTTRNYPRIGALGGDRGSPMARPAPSQGTPPVNEQVSIVATGATAGTFTLRAVARSGQIDVTTAAINFNDSLATLVSKLDTALGVPGRVTGVSGGPLPAACVVEFGLALGGTDVTVTVANNSLTGGTPVATISRAPTPGVVPMADPARRLGFQSRSQSSGMARPKGLGQ